MSTLPSIAANQSWSCGNGCGSCGIKPSLFEYSRTEHPNGDVESKSQRVFLSECCGAGLMLWDEGKQDFVAWTYVEHDRAPAKEAAGPAHVLRAWVERRFVGDEMVHETVNLQKMPASQRVQLEKHYRLEVIELAPVARGVDVGAERSASRNWLRASGKLPMVGWTLSDAYTEGWLGHLQSQLTPTTAASLVASQGNKVCRNPDGCTDSWKCSSAAVGDCGARTDTPALAVEEFEYRGRARHENGMLFEWQSIDATNDREAQAWAERAGNGVWERVDPSTDAVKGLK